MEDFTTYEILYCSFFCDLADSAEQSYFIRFSRFASSNFFTWTTYKMRGEFQGSALKLLMGYKIRNLPRGVSKSHHISAVAPIAQKMPFKNTNFKGFLSFSKLNL